MAYSVWLTGAFHTPFVIRYKLYAISHTPYAPRRQGFTLLEMIISIGVFSALVIAAIGITIGISNAQIKASAVQAVQDNIRFSIELMTKELRTGSQYDIAGFCGAPRGEAVRFIASNGETRTYYRDGDAVMRLAGTTDCGAAQPFLSLPDADAFSVEGFADDAGIAPDIAVENLRFTAGGTAPGTGDGQPWITVSLSLRSVGPKPVLDARMDLQTMVVQRFRDQ